MNCLNCNAQTSNPKFCSRSCSATYNNITGNGNRRKPEGLCKECNKPVHTRKTWCDDCKIKFSGRPPRKSRTFPSGLEDPSLNPSAEGNCLLCSKIITYKSAMCKSCSSKISAKIKKANRISDWLNGNWAGGTKFGLSQTVRDYLLELNNFSCSKCNFNIFHPDDNKTILEINHINGNGVDHRAENLEVLCPNCHALTSTYRGRNLGNGRPVFYYRKQI